MKIHPLHTRHPRRFETYRFVYPVLSRRSGGLSIGINLNPDKVCNFDCTYCQVDRRQPGPERSVDRVVLQHELGTLLDLVESGEIWAIDPFREVPESLRRRRDIAFSGDGDPTTCPAFDRIVEECARCKHAHGAADCKLVLITNAAVLHRPLVRRALETLDRNQGEIWAKLDAGREAYYRQVDRSRVPFARIIENIEAAARIRPLVIQSLFMRIHGMAPAEAEIEAYCERLCEITARGGKISLVQVHTVARTPAEAFVTALSDAQVDGLRERVQRLTGLPAQAFYGATSSESLASRATQIAEKPPPGLLKSW